MSHEVRSRIQRVEELAEEGYEPSAIASATRLPRALIEELLSIANNNKGEGVHSRCIVAAA